MIFTREKKKKVKKLQKQEGEHDYEKISYQIQEPGKGLYRILHCRRGESFSCNYFLQATIIRYHIMTYST